MACQGFDLADQSIAERQMGSRHTLFLLENGCSDKNFLSAGKLHFGLRSYYSSRVQGSGSLER